MFDVSFTELLIIGIVALVVIGPEKLPRVARTVGHLMGRAQRYVSDVKREIRQELDAADQAAGGLMTIRKEMQDAAQTLTHSVSDAVREVTQLGQEITGTAQKISAEVSEELAQLPASVPESTPDPTLVPDPSDAQILQERSQELRFPVTDSAPETKS